MKTFTFPLDVVLQARAAQENEARQQLAKALDQQRAATARVEEAVQLMSRLMHFISTESAGRFSVANRQQSWSIHQTQEKIVAGLRVAEAECEKATEEKRAAVLAARRNRELLERLREQRLCTWQLESARAEQHQFDDFAMTRRHQAAQLEGARS